MTTSEMFDRLLKNLKVGDTAQTISSRREEIAKSLNANFRGKNGSTDHTLMVGSFGRHTAIKGVSDLDMIYILPADLRPRLGDALGPRRILERVRDVLKTRYPKTEVRVDQCVVRVLFKSDAFKFEVQPAFEESDGTFSYPDTVTQTWKITKPRQEIQATQARNNQTSRNMRHLARLVRAWKNSNGVVMGGLLIDTLVYRFFENTRIYDSVGSAAFGSMVRDFFDYLSKEPDKNYYLALGSHQQVTVKGRFQPKALRAYKVCCEAIASQEATSATQLWRKVFGSSVPTASKAKEAARAAAMTEQFIEDLYPVDISDSVQIDCEVTQKGWRPTRLREMLRTRAPLRADKILKFWITECSTNEPYAVKWKVLNRGAEAERREMIRGQIIGPNKGQARIESSDFKGDHIVECYVIRDGIVVARDRINVPISNNSGER